MEKVEEKSIIAESQQKKNAPRAKKQKRPQNNYEEEDEDFDNLFGQTNAKKPANGIDFKHTKQIMLETMGRQMQSRKHVNEAVLCKLSKLVETLEADHQVLTENEGKLQRYAAASLKSAQQTANAAKQNVMTVKSILTKFTNECGKLESDEKAVNKKMTDELEDYINQLREKLISDTKKKQMESLQKSLYQAMHNF